MADGQNGGSGRRLRILVVDDEVLIGTVVVRILKSAHEVETTTDAAAALERMTAGERFDLILCDVLMPRMTGMELHRRVEALDAEQADRMWFLSGGAFTAETRAFLERMSDRHLQKPFDASTLRALVARIAGG